MHEPHQYYDVISVCLGDFEAEADWLADEQLLEQARTLTEDEWRELSNLMADMLYDNDAFHEAKGLALAEVLKRRKQREAAEVEA